MPLPNIEKRQQKKNLQSCTVNDTFNKLTNRDRASERSKNHIMDKINIL